MKEIIKNKWILIFVIMVVGTCYFGADTPKTFDEEEDKPVVNINI